MASNDKSSVSGVRSSKKPNGKDLVTSADPIKRGGQTRVSSGVSIGGGQPRVSSGVSIGGVQPRVSSGFSIGVPNPMKPNGKAASSSAGKAIVSSTRAVEVMFFRDLTLGPHEGELRFRLIHFWESRKPLTKELIGLEMLLIDEQDVVVQGFIPPGRMETYLPHMIAGSVYRLNKFYGSKNKTLYRVAEASVTVTFSWNSVLSVLEDSSTRFSEDHFRFHNYEEFEAACDLKGDLYDFIGHIKLVNGEILSDSLLLDEAEIASSRRVLLHVQTHDGPVMKLYLWDKAASEFCAKFKASASTPSVILVTTLNPKRFAGALSLCSMTSSRVFIDSEVHATRDYFSWLSSNMDVANSVNAEIVTKTEAVTIGELLSYIKQEAAKDAWFECTATIDDVVHGSPWYYISCGECHTKATKGPKSLMCKKCGKADIIGVPQYLAKLSVYDNSDQAVFVLLGDAGVELTGRQASDLVERYLEANEAVGCDDLIPVPQALIDTIGHTHKFIVKVSSYTSKIQNFTVTKVLQPEAPEPEAELEENVIVPNDNETLEIGIADDSPSTDYEETADKRVKRASDGDESEETKRAKIV